MIRNVALSAVSAVVFVWIVVWATFAFATPVTYILSIQGDESISDMTVTIDLPAGKASIVAPSQIGTLTQLGVTTLAQVDIPVQVYDDDILRISFGDYGRLPLRWWALDLYFPRQVGGNGDLSRVITLQDFLDFGGVDQYASVILPNVGQPALSYSNEYVYAIRLPEPSTLAVCVLVFLAVWAFRR